MLKTLVTTAFFAGFLLAGTVTAETYYVSPSGSNANLGSSPTDAWATIDYGDNNGRIHQGDTVFILSGTYQTTTAFTLDVNGTAIDPIVYFGLGRGPVILDGQGSATNVLIVTGDYTEIHNLEITRAADDGVLLQSAAGTIQSCYVHHCGGDGILLNETYAVFRHNISVFNGASGLRIDGFGDDTPIYGNTMCYNGQHGIYATSAVSDAVIANNILCGNGGYGVEGNNTIKCAYNDVWNNGEGYYHYCTDSGGGLIANPQFVDTANGRFDLRHTSPCVNTGSFRDYDYNGPVPDMGAIEKYTRYYVAVDGDDSADGRSVETAWRSIDNGDSLLLPGDTVYVLPGTYTDSVLIMDVGLPGDYICYAGVEDSTILDVSQYSVGVRILSAYVSWSGFTVDGAWYRNVRVLGVGNKIERCRIYNAGAHGLMFDGARNVAYGNILIGNTDYGILTNDDELGVYNNIFYKNWGISLSVINADSARICNNIFVPMTPTDVAIHGTDSSQLTHCIFYGYDEPLKGDLVMGTGCLQTDPRFIDAAKGDFHLRAESPAIDAGVNVGYPYHGNAPDIGVFETGVPAYFFIADNHDTLNADTGYQFVTLAYDDQGYPTRPGPVVWAHSFASGSISSTGLFTPGLTGTGKVMAEAAAYGLHDTSLTLTVVAGQLHELAMTPSSAILPIDSAIQFNPEGWDSKGNSVEEFGTITWDVLNGIGTIDQTGLFTASRAGLGYVRAISSIGPSCLSDAVTVTAGDPQIYATSLLMPIKELVPGTSTGPILALEFVNDHVSSVPLDSIRIRFTGEDPDGATREELDSQIESVALYLEKDNQYTTLSDSDSLLYMGAVDNGYAIMHTEGLNIQPNGGSLRLTVAALLNADNAKDGNSISFDIAEEADIYLGEVIPVVADFPIDNDVEYLINTFPSALASVNPVEGATLHHGQTDRLILDIEIPANGYSDDYLSSVKLVNAGTYEDNNEVLSVSLWADHTGDGFSGDDDKIGQFTYSTGFWQLSGLSHPLASFDNRLLVTVDIIGGNFDGGTLELMVPVKGIQYTSGADGPDDAGLQNPGSFVIMPADRVTAVSVPRTSTLVAPGSSNNTVLAFALYNGYGVTQSLKSIRFTNHSRTASVPTYADAELGQVTLHFDANNNRLFDGDPAVASGYFANGLLSLSPSNLTLPAESLCYFFVAADLPNGGAIDSDSLMVGIDSESDIVFEIIDGKAVSINGDLPLTSGAYVIIDGSVHSQYGITDITPGSLAPNDTSVTLICFRPAVNGDQKDTLTGVTVANAGTADNSDFEVLELWLDTNGDHIWQSTDSFITQFSYAGGNWVAESIGLEISPDPVCLLVTGDVSALATPGATFRAYIPVDGCQYTSGNDGPIDRELAGEAEMVISTSGLRICAEPLSPTYSVGQEITVPANVHNLLETPMDDVYCEFVAVNNESDSIVIGPMSLAPGQSVEYVGSFTASRVGEETWRIKAFSATPADTSVEVYTDEVCINQVPEEVTLGVVNSIPTAVSRGQSNVFPMSINFQHVDTSSIYSSLRLDSVKISVQDAYGAPQAASTAFSRMVLATDNINLVVANNIPASSSVWLRFTEPVIVRPGEKQLLSLLVDIDSSATATTFVLLIDAPTDVNIVDQNTIQTVPFSTDVVFPMATASCRIDEPSHELAVSSESLLNSYVNLGQQDVQALELSIRHPGTLGASQIQLTRMSLEFIDDNLMAVDPSDIVSGLKVLKQDMVIGELSTITPGSTGLTVNFTAPPTLSPAETALLYLQFDVKSNPLHDLFAVRIADSTDFEVRDLTSGSIIAAASDVELATGNVFPIISGFAQTKTPAVGPELCCTSVLPDYVIGGTEEVELLEFTLMYPVSNDHSSVCADDIVVRVYDSTGYPFNPNVLFDQVGVSINGEPIIYGAFVELRDGFTVFSLGHEGLMINPGDTTSVKLVADIESATPLENFMLILEDDGALSMRDATDTSSCLSAGVSASCPFTYPFETAVAQIYLQAGRPMVSTSAPPAQLAYPGQKSLKVLDISFSYNSSTPQGDLLLNKIVGTAVERLAAAAPARSPGDIFDAVLLMLDDDTLAIDSVFAGDTIAFAIDDGLTLSCGNSYQLTLRCDISSGAPYGNYRICMADSLFSELLDRNLLTAVYPNLSGESYPLRSAEISLVEANLENSFTNYPNPFNPETGDGTTIGYVLAEDARVDIELFTITGKLVKQVVIDGFREAGGHQQDTWDGRNERDMTVIPGTYFCRLTARYVSGRTETFKRKVAVVR